MRSLSVLRCAILAAALGAISACSTLRDEAGLTKQSPDEFAVTTKAPLIIPPDFNLRPPSPGAAPLNQTDPTSSAEIALFNNSDPAVVAAQMTGNYSASEKMLLANAGVQNANPTIRAELQSDQRAGGFRAGRGARDVSILLAQRHAGAGDPRSPRPGRHPDAFLQGWRRRRSARHFGPGAFLRAHDVPRHQEGAGRSVRADHRQEWR
jgi:hypothetical protein